MGKAAIIIQLGQSSHHAGDVVTGKLCLRVHSKIGTPMSAL